MYALLVFQVFPGSALANPVDATPAEPGIVPSPKIVGGSPLQITSRPFQAVVLAGGSLCGGSIIDRYWVLTAAHCTDGFTARNIRVGVGVQDLRNTYIEDYRNVSNIVQRPDYNNSTFNSDISLLRLASPLVFNPAVRPIALADSLPPDNSLVEVSGYGDTGHGSTPSYYLLGVEVRITNFRQCNAIYAGHLTENMFCAGVPEGGKDSCQGDSGGPLTYDGKLVGIVSFGSGCGDAGIPGIYTRVQNFRTWVHSTIF